MLGVNFTDDRSLNSPLASSEIERGHRLLVAQQALGGHDHQGLPEHADASGGAARWKICAGVVGCTTCMLLLRAQLQETLQTRRRMLGALALVAVRQHQRQARSWRGPTSDSPLDEMNWSITTGRRWRSRRTAPPRSTSVFGSAADVAVLEAQHRLLAQDRVDDDEGRLALGHVLVSGT
jgi:hypothetical protein